MTLAAAPLTTALALDAWDETRCLRSIRLALPADTARSHQRPGQVVKLHAPAGDTYFAIASAPAPGGTIELLLKRGGKVADSAVATALPGATLHVSAPFGQGFPVEEAYGRHVLLFAAGSGIAPIRALVQHILAHRGRVVRVVLCPSQEDEAWPGVRGRVQEVAASLAFGGSPPEASVAFVCGMTAMVEDVRATLAAAGIPPERVHLNF